MELCNVGNSFDNLPFVANLKIVIESMCIN